MDQAKGTTLPGVKKYSAVVNIAFHFVFFSHIYGNMSKKECPPSHSFFSACMQLVSTPESQFSFQFTVITLFTRKYYPSSKQFRDPPTYTHQPSMQQKVPFSLIRCSSSKVAFCSCVCGVRLAHI